MTDPKITAAEEMFGPEFVDSARIMGRVVAGIKPDEHRDRWDADLAVAYIESLTPDELQGALFVAGFMLAVQKCAKEQEDQEGQ